MVKMYTEEKTYLDMKQLIEMDHESLLNELKDRACNVEITKRKEFENALLKLAGETTDDNKRNAVYEVLVSLKSIWEQYQPEKGLQEKFRTAFIGENYNEAEEYYKRLARQGLDHIETFNKREGEIFPVSTDENDMLLQYNKKEITLYTPQFELLTKLSMPESLEIIHVHIPPEHHETGCTEMGIQKMWLLLQDKTGKKAIASIEIESIESTRKQFQNLKQRTNSLSQELKDVFHLSCFQNHLLLVSKKFIQYRTEKGECKEWYYTTKDEITTVESIGGGVWIGHSNGDVIILKNLQYVGNRDAFKGFEVPIKRIRKIGKYVLILSKNFLRIADQWGNPVSEPLETQCEIIQSTILNEDILLMLMANGMLIARELTRKNISWQINLANNYEMLFTFKQCIYCGKRDGETMVFEIPPFNTMAKELASKNIHVYSLSIDTDPNAPVKHISDFVGRRELLNEIKEAGNAHFLLYGESRVGKTSLLNVLRDTLSDRAKCCLIDMAQVLKEVDSHKAFFLKFMENCLAQHFIKLSELPEKDSSSNQALRAMITKIRGSMSFFVLAMDNFVAPSQFDRENREEFRTFLRTMFIYTDVRIIITGRFTEKMNIEKYIESLNLVGQRKFNSKDIPLLSEGDVKNAFRKNISLQQSVVDEIYKYTGRFPHLIHFYDRWKPGHHSIQEQSKLIAETFNDKIFDYFRDLSINARLLIATCLFENLIAENMGFSTLYEKFPFLNTSLPKNKLEEAVKEIDGYGSGLSARAEENAFKISLSDNALLFFESAKHNSWIKDFKILYDFTSLPDPKRAHRAADTFARITRSALEPNECLEQMVEKYNDKFYIGKLTEQGMQALKMPLTTFVVFSLSPWRKEVHMDDFRNLSIEFREFNRKAGESKIFYILLFELHGIPKDKVKQGLEGLERISIIDSSMMKDILMAESPQEKAIGYIFDQLSIKERSPYTTAGAVPDNLFFGRQMEIALIRGLPENMGIFGTRTIGKTSLLRKLHRAFKSQKQWKVYDLDCGMIESEESLLKNLAEKMEVPFEQISDMEKFRQYVTKNAETGNHRYLFLLDEVDRLVEYDLGHNEKIFNTFNRLSNETMKNNETAARFILFGFQQMFEQMKNPLSRLYNFMVFMPLKPLDMEGAMSLVTGPIENTRVRWNNKKDANYLVDNCSRHPRLLQAACHALLSNLDDKEEKRDIIERTDVDKALTSHEFREICMRFYHEEEKGNGDFSADETKKEEKKKTFIERILRKDTSETPVIEAGKTDEENTIQKRKEFLTDLHRITILAAVRFLFGERKENFSITDIQAELKSYGIDVSPNIMRNILDQLCLSGNFRLLDESTIISKKPIRPIQEDDNIKIEDIDMKVDKPDFYAGSDTAIPRFTYEFGVKIFPKLLVAHFGGIKQCEEERKKLIEKGAWKEWLGRY